MRLLFTLAVFFHFWVHLILVQLSGSLFIQVSTLILERVICSLLLM